MRTPGFTMPEPGKRQDWYNRMFFFSLANYPYKKHQLTRKCDVKKAVSPFLMKTAQSFISNNKKCGPKFIRIWTIKMV
jgi:hypothetical protein